MEALLFMIPFALGAALFVLARWARRRSIAFQREHGNARSTDGYFALQEGKVGQAVQTYLFGRMPKGWNVFGVVAIAVTATAVALTAAYVVITILSR